MLENQLQDMLSRIERSRLSPTGRQGTPPRCPLYVSLSVALGSHLRPTLSRRRSIMVRLPARYLSALLMCPARNFWMGAFGCVGSPVCHAITGIRHLMETRTQYCRAQCLHVLDLASTCGPTARCFYVCQKLSTTRPADRRIQP